MTSQGINWTNGEQKIARRALDAALVTALADLIADFKRRAAAVTEASEMWQIEIWLREQRKHIDYIFDYRYSQMHLVFARLIHDGLMEEYALSGLSDEHLTEIRKIRSIWQ